MIIHPPEKKKDLFVAQITNKKGRVVRVSLRDTKIFHVQPLNSDGGYLLKIFVPHDSAAHETVTDLDERAVKDVITNNEAWFENRLSQQHIQEFFRPCIDRECMSVIVSASKIPRTITYNSVSLDSFDTLLQRNVTKANVECTLEATGLYFYPKKFGIKWILRDIEVYSGVVCDEPECNEKRDVEDFWAQELQELSSSIDADISTLSDKIDKLREFQKNLQDLLSSAKSERECTSTWNETLDMLKSGIVKYHVGRL